MVQDRFDFEQQILNCWRITDDIKEVSDSMLEGDLNTEETTNVLIGLRQMYELKFNKLWDLFESVHMGLVRDSKMAHEECDALRLQLQQATNSVPVITAKKGKK